MTRMSGAWGVLVAAFVVTGCDQPAGPDVVTFERLSPPGGGFTPQVFSIDGNVAIQAVFATPCEPYDATASADVRGAVLRLTVRGNATGACPLDLSGSFYYRATIAHVPTGRYAVRAIHTYADAYWPADSLEFGTLDLP